ncbi:MAG: pseudouridine synthase [Cyanobacteria bacterium J06650_10]
MAYRYLLFYKPYNVLSQFTDSEVRLSKNKQSKDKQSKDEHGEGRQTLKDFIDVPGVYAVGRLDRDSEGLLLLTDDGKMQHRLSHPKFGHWRQYWAQVEQSATSPPIESALEQLRTGVTIRGYRTQPAKAREISPPDLPPRKPPIRYRKQVPTAWLELMLSEGKNRQVRRMTAAVGFPTLRLVRGGIWLTEKITPKTQPLTLRGLQPGEWRDLTPAEVRSLPRQTPNQTPEQNSRHKPSRHNSRRRKR